jgi:ankyrin repeat protein
MPIIASIFYAVALISLNSTPRVLAWRIILQRTQRKDVIKSYQQLFPMDMEDFGFSLLHEIITEVKHGELKNAVMKLPAAIDKVDYEERTPLMWASVRCNKAAIDILLKYGADPLLHDKNGNTALYFAALGGSIECVKALIKAGAKLQKGYLGLNPIHRACDTHDDVGLVAALLRLPHDINAKDSFSRSYLGTAAWRNHYKSLAYLLRQGADYEALDAFNATPLLRAVRYGAVEAAEVLLNFGVNVLAKDKSQQTILHRAAASRSQRMLKFLADKAAEKLAMVDVEAKDIGSMTARERLHELEPTAELLAAFTRLVSAISRAKAEIDRARLERTLLPEYESESEKEDEEIFFDAFESADFMTTTPSKLALAV